MKTLIAKAVTDILIKEWEKQKINNVKMAKMTGLTKDTLWKIRNGHRNAGLDSACVIAKALKINIGEIIDTLSQ